MYRLTKWQRFWKLDVPSSMIGLVWNMMMSMGGGWFFLTASEAVTVFIKGKGLTESLPGIGSYMAAAVADGLVQQGDHRHRDHGRPGRRHELLRLPPARRLGRAVPHGDARSRPTSPRASCSTCCVGRRSRTCWPRLTRPIGRLLDRVTRPFGLAEYPLRPGRAPSAASATSSSGPSSSPRRVSWPSAGSSTSTPTLASARFPSPHRLGFATFARVVVLLVISTIIWVPVGSEDRHEPQPLPLSPSPSCRCSPASRPSCSSRSPPLIFIDARRPAGLRRHPPHDAGRAVVHPVQRDRRSQRHPQRPARDDDRRCGSPGDSAGGRSSCPPSSRPTSPAGSPRRAEPGTHRSSRSSSPGTIRRSTPTASATTSATASSRGQVRPADRAAASS